MRLDRFIQTRIPRLSRTRANQIVRACAYHQDGRRRRPSERVRFGETVILVRPAFEEREVPREFGVIYEDDALLVIDKPAGLPVHPSASYHKNTLTYLLRERYPDPTPHLAHRLDRETSGVLVCAKTVEDERAVKGQFERRETAKTYRAIVRGIPDAEGQIELPMGRVTEGLHLLMEVKDEGSAASTGYRVVARAPAHALVELYPKTGRQHQLRVHLAAIGHPIVADKLYGPEGPAPFLEYVDAGEVTPELEARLGHPRQALHAHQLVIKHPRSDAPLTLVAPLPEDLLDLWERLGGEPLSSGVPSSS